MMRSYSSDPNIEVSGQVVASMTQNFASQRFSALRAKHGLQQVDPKRWYKLEHVFNFLNDVVEAGGDDQITFTAMGIRISQQSEFPPEMRSGLTLAQILEGWQAHYEANHRGGSLPPVLVDKLNEQHYRLTLNEHHLYPYDLVYGMLYGFCKALLPEGTSFEVTYDAVRSARNPAYRGDIVIDVKW